MAFLKRIIREKELILLLIVGLLAIIVIDKILVGVFYREEEYRERLMAERLQAQVQSSLEEHVTALIALKVVYQNFTDINQYDFQQYGKSITSTLSGFQRLFYIDPSLTIRQVYPNTPENSGLYDYSLTGQNPLAKTLIQARYSKDATTSRLLPFLNHPRSFWAFIPIYRNGKEFLGFAAGEISLEELWAPYSKSLSQYQIQLIDPNNTTLFRQVSLNPNDPTVTKLPFNLAGQQWRLYVKPVNPSSETLLLQRSSLWTGGLLILFLLGFIIQNSKRHKSELEEAQQQFETIFEASPDGILLVDDKLNLQISNPVVRHWLGKSEAELTGKNFFDLFQCRCPNLGRCSELSFLLCTSSQFAQDLPDILETNIIDTPDGTPKTLRLNASKINQDRGGKKEEGFICVLGDISTSKELERVRETYVATLTHDLKTPLLAQQLVLESLGTGSVGPINDEQKRLLGGAKDSVQDMLDMVNSTLLFYKLESSHVSLNRQRKQMAPLIRDVMGSLQPIAEKRGVALELETALDLPDAWIDILQIKRVLHNLISNAISYGKRNTPIRVMLSAVKEETGQDSESLLIEIRNEGKGISPEDLPKIFDKYYSLSRRFKQIGTGLGLYISRRLVELHGGKLWAESEPNRETSFFIRLPKVQQIEQASPPKPQPLPAET